MHRIISVLLIISLLATAFSRYMIIAGYELNQGYIADKLCVNKANPMLHCNGKCYLAKKIKEEEQAQQKQQSSSSKPVFVEALLSTSEKFTCYLHQTGEFTSLYKAHYLFKVQYSIFHPPPRLS